MWNLISYLLRACSCVRAPSSSQLLPPSEAVPMEYLHPEPTTTLQLTRDSDCLWREGKREVRSFLKLKDWWFSNTFASKILKRGRALKWGAKAVSKLLEQVLIEVKNKHFFSLGTFTASEESVFPLFQFLYFSLVNDFFIRNGKLITG